MEYDYGGLLGLAQTALAINMAYIALERFRYGSQIRDHANDARSQTKEFTDSYVDDRAWLNVQQIEAGDDPRAWTIGRTGYWVYFLLFRRSTDIVASYIFAFVALLTIAWQASSGISPNRLAGGRVWPDSALLDCSALAILIVGTLAPVGFVLAGRYAVRCASRSITDNMDHLMSHYRKAASDDVNAKLRGLESGETGETGETGEISN